jgi:hypothetical protein
VGTIQPLPILVLAPRSGPPKSNVTISGQFFAPRSEYLVYWDAREETIGTVVTDGLGQIPAMIYEIPDRAIVGKHQVVVEQLDGVVVARASFSVTAQ